MIKASTSYTPLDIDSRQDGDEHMQFGIHPQTQRRKQAAIKNQLSVNGTQLKMELDMDASCSVISEETYRKIWGPNPPSLRDTHGIEDIRREGRSSTGRVTSSSQGKIIKQGTSPRPCSCILCGSKDPPSYHTSA